VTLLLHLCCLALLLDKLFIIRDRYKVALEYDKTYFALWIYIKDAQKEYFHKYKRIFIIKFK
jgi:hypothetical protein